MVHHNKNRRLGRRVLISTSALVSSASLLVTGILPALPAHAQWAGTDRSIIYEKDVTTPAGQTYEYHVINPDGTNDRKLNLAFPAGVTTVTELRFSKDGTKIAYFGTKAGNVNVYYADAKDGKNAVLLSNSTAGKTNLMWKSDGTRLYWVENSATLKQMVILGGVESTISATLPSGFGGIYSAVMAPNDYTIAFSADDSNNGYLTDIFTVPTAGGTATNITNTTGISERLYDWGTQSSKLFIYNGSNYGLVLPDGSGFSALSSADLTAAGIQYTNYITLSPGGDGKALAKSKVIGTTNTYKMYVINPSSVYEIPNVSFDGDQGVTGYVLGWSSADLSGLVTSTSKLPNTGVAKHLTTSIGVYGVILSAIGGLILAAKRRVLRPRFARN